MPRARFEAICGQLRSYELVGEVVSNANSKVHYINDNTSDKHDTNTTKHDKS